MNKIVAYLTFALVLTTLIVSSTGLALSTANVRLSSSGSIMYSASDAGWEYISSLIAGRQNLETMSRWRGTTWGGDPSLPNVWFWNQDNVRTPNGNPTWRSIPWTSAYTNPHREIIGDYHSGLHIGDLIVMRIWARSDAPTHPDVWPGYSTTIAHFDLYGNGAVDTSIGQVQEHNSDGRNSQGQYLCDVEDWFWNIDHINDYSVHSVLPVNSVAKYPETDGWVQLQMTSIIPGWNPNLIPYGSTQPTGAYEILTYYKHGWSPVPVTAFVPVVLGAKFGLDQGSNIWLGDVELYIIPAGQYDPMRIGTIVT